MSKPIRTVIVDDETDSLHAIEAQLKLYCPSLEVVGTFSNPFEAREKILQIQPELVFTHIEMPRMNGLQLAQKMVLPLL